MEQKGVDDWGKRYREWAQKSPEREKGFQTASGIPLKPLYTSVDLEQFDEERDLGFPGEYPYTRGIYPSMYRSRVWTKRLLVGHEVPETFNRKQRELMKAGQTGISLVPCNSYLRGYDSDMVDRELVGRCGTAVDSLQDVKIGFDNIPLDRVTTGLNDGGPHTLVAMYFALAEKQGIPLAKLNGTTNQADFISHWVAVHMYCRFPSEAHLRCMVDHVKFCTERVPKWHPLSFIGQHMGEQGATPLQELSFTLSTAIFCVSELIKSGMEVDRIGPRLSFFFTVRGDLFDEVAKFRAGRRMWAKIMRDRFGAKDPRSWQLRFHAQTTGVELTQQQPLNNIVRSTVHTLAAIYGGAQSIHTDSYDEALWTPVSEAQQVALMTQN